MAISIPFKLPIWQNKRRSLLHSIDVPFRVESGLYRTPLGDLSANYGKHIQEIITILGEGIF